MITRKKRKPMYHVTSLFFSRRGISGPLLIDRSRCFIRRACGALQETCFSQKRWHQLASPSSFIVVGVSQVTQQIFSIFLTTGLWGEPLFPCLRQNLGPWLSLCMKKMSPYQVLAKHGFYIQNSNLDLSQIVNIIYGLIQFPICEDISGKEGTSIDHSKEDKFWASLGSVQTLRSAMGSILGHDSWVSQHSLAMVF